MTNIGHDNLPVATVVHDFLKIKLCQKKRLQQMLHFHIRKAPPDPNAPIAPLPLHLHPPPPRSGPACPLVLHLCDIYPRSRCAVAQRRLFI